MKKHSNIRKSLQSEENLLVQSDNDSDNAYDNTIGDAVTVVEVYTNRAKDNDLSIEDKSYIMSKFLSNKSNETITIPPVPKQRSKVRKPRSMDETDSCIKSISNTEDEIQSIASNATYDIPIPQKRSFIKRNSEEIDLKSIENDKTIESEQTSSKIKHKHGRRVEKTKNGKQNKFKVDSKSSGTETDVNSTIDFQQNDKPKTNPRSKFSSAQKTDETVDNVDKCYILGIHIFKTDCLLLNSCVLQPIVRIFLIDCETGEFVKKSDPRRNVMISQDETEIDYISMFVSKPCKLYKNRQIIPNWNETIFLNDDFNYISRLERLIMFFEIIESHTLNNSSQGNDNNSEIEYIAWAFLKPQQNFNKNIRLQLYYPHKTNTKHTSPSVAYKWWLKNRRRKYPATLYVALKKTDIPDKVIKLWNAKPFKQENLQESLENQGNEIETKDNSEKFLLSEITKPNRIENGICQFSKNKILAIALKEGSLTMKFSNNGEYLSIASNEESDIYNILIYSISSETELFRFESHQGFIYDLTWTLNDQYLISASADYTAIIWNVHLRKIESILPHPTFVYCVACTTDNLIATGAYDKVIRVWNLSSHALLAELPEHNGYITSLCFNKEDYFLYSTDSTGSIRMWQRDQCNWLLKQDIQVPELQNVIINEAILHKRERRLIVHSRDGFLRLVDIKTGYVLQKYAKGSNENILTRCALTPCGTYLLAGNAVGDLYIWIVDTGRIEEVRCPFHTKIAIHSVQYHANRSLMAVSHYGSNVSLVVYASSNNLKEKQKEIEINAVEKTDTAKLCQNGSNFRLILEKLDNIMVT